MLFHLADYATNFSHKSRIFKAKTICVYGQNKLTDCKRHKKQIRRRSEIKNNAACEVMLMFFKDNCRFRTKTRG